MSDLVRRNVDSWADVLPSIGDLAAKVAGTDFVPEAMRGKPAVVAAAILYGRELGLEPMTALRSINVIKGTPSVKPEAMRGMVLAAGHDIRFPEMTATRCVAEGRRIGQEEYTRVIYSMDDAKRAGLSGSNQYSKYPRQMLSARATAELCRLIFADVIGGLMADIELEDDVEVIPSAAPTTVARRKTKQASPPAPETEPVLEVEEEPVLEEEILEAEIIEDKPAEAMTPVQVEAFMNAPDEPVIEDSGPSGPSRVRAALNAAKAGDTGAQVSPEQMGALMAGFNAIGVRDRDQRLNIARVLADRETLDSAKDLTMKQASAVIQGLQFIQAAEDPAAMIEGLIS